MFCVEKAENLSLTDSYLSKQEYGDNCRASGVHGQTLQVQDVLQMINHPSPATNTLTSQAGQSIS